MEFSVAVDGQIVRKALIEVEALYTAADCGLSYMALAEKLKDQEQKNDFWFHTRGALRGTFVINWCKLFGVDVKNGYWKQTTLEQKPFREAVYQATGFDYRAWDSYRKAMSELRAVLIDHLNPYYPIDQLPDFEPALAILKVCHHWLRQVAEAFDIETQGPLAQEYYFEKVQQDIDSTLNKF